MNPDNTIPISSEEVKRIQEHQPDYDYVRCSCCGRDIPDKPDINLDYEERLQDTSFGRCTDCFGEPAKKDGPRDHSDEAVRKRLGWAGRMFYESRFDKFRAGLSPENQVRWDSKSYAVKVSIIVKLIERGLMI